MIHNPFTLTFGQIPTSCISRDAQLDEIVNDFFDPNPSSRVYLLTGLRGSGKTVALTELTNLFGAQDDWIVLDLNPELDLLNSMAHRLTANHKLSNILKNVDLNLSAFGFSAAISMNKAPEKDPETVLLDELEQLSAHGKSVLITIDEIACSKNLKAFVSEFQMWVRRGCNVFLLGAGLFENIKDLNNKETLTYLYRSPTIYLSPLDMPSMANEYARLLSVPTSQARQLASLTRGYSYGYQILGYCMFKHKNDQEAAVADFDRYMRERCYLKIWSELSEMDQRILETMAEADTNSVTDIREKCQMDSKLFGNYRIRLLDKGIIFSPAKGCIKFVLPRFREFIFQQIEFWSY